MPKKNETNIEFVTRIMDFAPTGAMSQMFVIDALGKIANKIVEDAEGVKKAMEGGFVDGAAWVKTAEFIKSELDAKYGGAA